MSVLYLFWSGITLQTATTIDNQWRYHSKGYSQTSIQANEQCDDVDETVGLRLRVGALSRCTSGVVTDEICCFIPPIDHQSVVQI
jgi:hypothetical protein